MNTNQQAIIQSQDNTRQEKGKINSLPYILIFAGLAEGGFVSIIAFSIVRRLTSLYETIGTGGYTPTLTYLVLGIIGLSCLSQIIYGLILWFKRKKPETISKNFSSTAKILLIVGGILFFLSIPFIMVSVIMPIYRLTSFF